MALLSSGRFEDLTLAPSEDFVEFVPAVGGFSTVAEASESTRPAQIIGTYHFAESAEARGVALKRLRLTRGFEGFLRNLWKDRNEVYFTCWAWDFSGLEAFTYPAFASDAEDVMLPLKPGDVREFGGEGTVLFPARVVAGGISLRIQVWESDGDVRNAGETIEKISSSIKNSPLNQALKLISLAGGVQVATLSLIKDAALEVASVVGKVLKANSDDYVDLFEGYYAVNRPWDLAAPLDELKGYGTEVHLSRL